LHSCGTWWILDEQGLWNGYPDRLLLSSDCCSHRISLHAEPAVVLGVGIDLVYSVVNVFLSSELSEDQQGMAGSLAHALVRFSDTLLLGVARGVTADGLDTNDRASYRGAFWLQVACEVGALCIVLLYVRIGKAGADEEVKGDEKMLDDEYQELSISK
jgi:hypothetical protein